MGPGEIIAETTNSPAREKDNNCTDETVERQYKDDEQLDMKNN